MLLMNVAMFTFSDWSENTYVLYDDSKECCIVDPGCNNDTERNQLMALIKGEGLTPTVLVNTHCHIDHVLGNKFVHEHYSLPLTSHRGEQVVLDGMVQIASMYGTHYEPGPDITLFLEEGDYLSFGNTNLEVYFTPGHSPASISFFHRESKQLIAGDVLFNGSIGRTDLPGGNLDTLLSSIADKFYPLGDDVTVYSGHGPTTTIGEERKSNPFLSGI